MIENNGIMMVSKKEINETMEFGNFSSVDIRELGCKEGIDYVKINNSLYIASSGLSIMKEKQFGIKNVNNTVRKLRMNAYEQLIKLLSEGASSLVVGVNEDSWGVHLQTLVEKKKMLVNEYNAILAKAKEYPEIIEQITAEINKIKVEHNFD